MKPAPVVRPPLHLHLILDPGPKHGGRLCSPTLHPSKSRAELERGQSGDQRGSTALPVPNHHHGKLESLNLTTPKNGRTRVEGRRQKKCDLFAVLLAREGTEGGGGWTKW